MDTTLNAVGQCPTYRIKNLVIPKEKQMKSFRLYFLIFAALMALCSTASAETRLRMATTTSTENSGLLKVLLPPFEKQHDCKVDVIAVGTGKALKLGMAGDVDLVLVHARKKEDAFVSEGYGINRKDVMYNDFVILGPAADPAGIAGLTDAAEALKKIAAAKATFVSRGDQSGTHTKERELWQAAGIEPAGDWYLEAGRGMGEVINMAGERQGYTLSDRGTYIAYQDKTDLKVQTDGDKRLFNPYGVIPVNPAKHPHAKFELATAFADYLTGEQGQQIIAGYQKNGQNLFFIYQNLAGK